MTGNDRNEGPTDGNEETSNIQDGIERVQSGRPEIEDPFDEENFTDFSLFGNKKRSLLEYCTDPSLTEQVKDSH